MYQALKETSIGSVGLLARSVLTLVLLLLPTFRRKMTLRFAPMTCCSGLVNGVEVGVLGHVEFAFLYRLSGERVGGGGVVGFLSAVLGFKDLGPNFIGLEIFNLAGCKEGVLEVGVGLREGEEDHGSVLPIRDDELVDGAGSPQLMVAVELGLQRTIINKVGPLELVEVQEGRDTIPGSELLLQVLIELVGRGFLGGFIFVAISIKVKLDGHGYSHKQDTFSFVFACSEVGVDGGVRLDFSAIGFFLGG